MIYLDSAATSLQKPAAVGRAMLRAMGTMTTPGRGLSPPAMAAAGLVFDCRVAAARLLGAGNPEQVVFTCNATHGLNIAIKSIVKPGDTVLISGYEHNAVTRPLAAIGGVTLKIASCAPFEPQSMLYQMEQKLTGEVACVVCTHVSNVFGFVLPVEEIAALCRQKRVPLILDVSQSAGAVPVTFDAWGAAFAALPGHKGLLGPQGTGILLCNHAAKPLMEGGTGSEAKRQEMPEFLPDRLEAGTHNVTGLAGLLEGIRYVEKRGTAAILAHERTLIERMVYRMERMLGVRAYGAPYQFCQTGVLSFHLYAMDCEQVAEGLALRDVAVRAGLHCSPLAHNSAGTMGRGTVRASVSPFTTAREVERFLDYVEQLAREHE